jgi:hypothetical protein
MSVRLLAIAIALACGGRASPEPFGWCCADLCGLTGEEAAAVGGTCACDGIVRPDPIDPLIYECLEDWTR